MRSEFREFHLSDLGTLDRGKSRHRPRYAEHLYGGAYPFIQTGDIKAAGGRIRSFAQTYSEAGLAQSRLWPVNTLCITIAANIAETAILTFPACFPDSVVGFLANEKVCDVRYVEYWFRAFRESVQQRSYGTVQDNINLEVLRGLKLLIPTLETQTCIADTLSLFDERIDLLRQTNATLESIAQALFKSWFIDFDPVRAKAEGREPEGMDAATAALFPAEFEESALGLIPKGWGVTSFADTVQILGGGTPKTSVAEYWGGDVPWFSVVDAPAPGQVFTLNTEKFVTKVGVENSSTRILPVWTTIISARGTVGKLAMTGRPMAMNQSCYGLVPKIPGTEPLVYLAAQNLVADLQRLAHGGVFDTITRDTLSSVAVVQPPTDLRVCFAEMVKPMFTQIQAGVSRAENLVELRDTLLPRLISGKLRLPEAQAQMEALE